MSEGTATSLTLEEDQLSETSKNDTPKLEDLADDVLRLILKKHKDVSVIISSTDGRCLTSTLRKRNAQDAAANIFMFTDKVAWLMKKLFDEDLKYVRMKGKKNEIVVTFDDEIDIITIQKDFKK